MSRLCSKSSAGCGRPRSRKASTKQEVAGVYDKRMLNVLFKAWMFDQGMAVRPQAVQAALPMVKQGVGTRFR